VIAFYLWTGTYADDTARESVKELTQGSLALILWPGAIIIGLIVPLVLCLITFLGSSAPGQMAAVVLLICSIIGGLTFTYAILKAGVYRPIIPGH
jgi:formate-dependent nitrite reductase membrane component NrfD